MASSKQLAEVYGDYKSHFLTHVANKLYDNNTWKASSTKVHMRELVVPSIHRYVFEHSILSRCSEEENKIQYTEPFCQLETVGKIGEMLDTSELPRFHKNGDVSFVAPWGVVLEDVVY